MLQGGKNLSRVSSALRVGLGAVLLAACAQDAAPQLQATPERQGRVGVSLARDWVRDEATAQPLPGTGSYFTRSQSDARYCKLAGCTLTGITGINDSLKWFWVGGSNGTRSLLGQAMLCLGGGDSATGNCTTGAKLLWNPNAVTLSNQLGGAALTLLSTGISTSGEFTVGAYERFAQYLASDGETGTTLQARAPAGGGGAFEYDTTVGAWRAYESYNQSTAAGWNRVATYNPDGGLPLINPALVPATVADVVTGTSGSQNAGLVQVSDRSPFGRQLQYGNGQRGVQLGGAENWALEARSLAINVGHESTVIRCNECTPTTLTAFDGLTVTDAAAGGTTIIDSVDVRTLVTAAVINSTSSVVSRAAETRRNQFPHMVWNVYVAATTLERVWFGLGSVALSGSDAPVGHVAAFRYSTNAGDTKWQACTGDGVTTTCTDTGVTVQAGRLYTLEVDCRVVGGGKCVFTVAVSKTALATLDKSTNLPTLGNNLFMRAYCETLSGAARTCGIGPSVLETF